MSSSCEKKPHRTFSVRFEIPFLSKKRLYFGFQRFCSNSMMASVHEKVVHDHDYCITKEEENDSAKSVEKDIVEPESPSNSLCLSPAYSCDSGIDSFACNLAQRFGKVDDDLLDCLFDEELFPGLDSPENKEAIDVKTPNVNSSRVSYGVKSENALSLDYNASELDIIERNKKNADNARENRKKKKFYVFGLEKEVEQLRTEKDVLTGKTFKLEGRVNELEEEVDYLKSILANQSMLSKLLGSLSVTPGISLSTSFCSSRQGALEEDGKENMLATRSRKRACNSQKSAQQGVTNKRSRKTGSGGVCLHVKENKVSLEFCRICSKTAGD